MNYSLFLKKGLIMTCVMLTVVSCQRSSRVMWDDTKSAGRYMGRSIKALGGKQGDSKQISSRQDFAKNSQYDYELDYIPYDDEEIAYAQVSRSNYSSPTMEQETNLSIDQFVKASDSSQYASIFETLYFNYNSSLLSANGSMDRVKKIANYLKANPNVQVYIEGHCDQRGSQAFNIALGSRRSNTVKKFLVSQGVSADRLHTISYGKERPISSKNDEEGWKLNRRVEFRVYKQ